MRSPTVHVAGGTNVVVNAITAVGWLYDMIVVVGFEVSCRPSKCLGAIIEYIVFAFGYTSVKFCSKSDSA